MREQVKALLFGHKIIDRCKPPVFSDTPTTEYATQIRVLLPEAKSMEEAEEEAKQVEDLLCDHVQVVDVQVYEY